MDFLSEDDTDNLTPFLKEPGHSYRNKEITEDEMLKILLVQYPEKGFDLLFRKYYSGLCNNCVRFVQSRSVAEDLVSDIFIEIWQKKIFLEIEVSFKAYLYRSVRYRSQNYLNSVIFKKSVPLNEETCRLSKCDNSRPDGILEYHELSYKIDQIIKNLPAQSRKAFQMSRLEDKKYREIASALGITVSAVERLISRALSKIKQELKSNGQ